MAEEMKVNPEPMVGQIDPLNYYGIDLSTIPDRAEEFVRLLEIETTNRMCLCEWHVHPDDEFIAEGHCRVCGGLRNIMEHKHDHKFAGRRMRPGTFHPECPVHTKEGLIIGFLKWLKEKE